MVYGYYYIRNNEFDENTIKSIFLSHNVEKVFFDHHSNLQERIFHFNIMLDNLKKGDIVIFPNPISTGFSTKELVGKLNFMSENGINFLVAGLKYFNTTNEFGLEFKRILSILADLKTDSEREKEGRPRGNKGGRKPGLSPERIILAKKVAELYIEGVLTSSEISDLIGIKSRATIYRYLRYQGIKINSYNNDENRKKYLKIINETKIKYGLGTKNILIIKSAFEIFKHQEKDVVTLVNKNPDLFKSLENLLSKCKKK